MTSGRATRPAPRPRRLETQILHREDGSWRPYTYIWQDDQADATLADPGGASRTLSVSDRRAAGGRGALVYRFAARSECVLCHNPWVEARGTVFGVQSASPLAFRAAQLDRAGPVPRTRENQLIRLERLGYFAGPLPTPAGGSPRLADPYDEKAGLDARARAYLEVNCAHCHLSGAGGSAAIALGASLTLDETRTVGTRPIQGAFGIDDARIIAPGEPEQSVLYYRIAKTGAGRMPRIGSQRVDDRGTRLIADWIEHMGTLPKHLAEPHALLAGAEPAGQAEAIRRMTGSTREALGLVRLIDQGAIPLATLRAVITETRSHSPGEIRDLFERFAPDAEKAVRLGDAIEPEAILGLPGDAERGRELFNAPATACKSCHRIGSIGAELGPDLDAIGSKYNRLELLGQILEPARTVESRYALHVVEAKDGRVHQGMIVEEPPGLVVLRDAQNRTTRIATSAIERQVTQAKSLMPEGLLRDLTAQQAADLLEYLSSQQGRSSVTPREDAWRRSIAGTYGSLLHWTFIAGWATIGLGSIGLSLKRRCRERRLWLGTAALALLFAFELAFPLRFALADRLGALLGTVGGEATIPGRRPIQAVVILILLAAAYGLLTIFLVRKRRLPTPCKLSVLGMGVGLSGMFLQTIPLPQTDRYDVFSWSIWYSGLALALTGILWTRMVRAGVFSSTGSWPHARDSVGRPGASPHARYHISSIRVRDTRVALTRRAIRGWLAKLNLAVRKARESIAVLLNVKK